MIARNAEAELFTPARKLDILLELLMVVLCFFAPLAFGSIEAWSQEIVIAIVTALVACAALRCFLDPTTKFVRSWGYLAIVVFLALCLMQLIPVPAAIMRVVSAGTYQLKAELLGDLPAAPSILHRMTITFYAAASHQQLRVVVAVSAIFILVTQYYVTAARIKRLLLTIAVAGLAVALLAVYQNLTGDDTVYGIVPAIDKNSGPFMCYSHFGQFMNLSVGGAFGLLLVQLAEVYQRRHNTANVIEELREPRSWMVWFLAAICVVGPITVFLSLTKMGIISLLVAGGFTGAMLTWRSRSSGRASLLLAMGIVVFAVLLAVGFDAVYARLATLRHARVVEGGRLQMLQDMTAEFKLFPLVGTGLGTHEFVFPMFDQSHNPRLAAYAENEYAQLFEECGIIGVAAAALFLGCMVCNYFKTIWRPQKPLQFAAYGLGLGLVAILIHSASDFGQHLPANVGLTAIFAGLLVNLAGVSRSAAQSNVSAADTPPWFAMPRLLPFGVLLVMVAVLGGTLFSADKSRWAESAWNHASAVQAILEKKDWQGTNEEYSALIAPAKDAADLMPDNVTYRYWLNVYRWRSITRVTDSKTHAVLFTPQSLTFAARIIDELQSIRPLCPTFGPPLCVAGQIEHFVFGRPEGLPHIEQAFRLAPYDRTVCFIAGKLAVEAGDWDQSLAAFKRCAALSGFDSEMIDIYVAANRPDLALKIAEGKRQELSYLANRLQGDPHDQDIAAYCQSQATALLLVEAEQPDASAEAMAEMAARYAEQNNPAQAIDWYRKALRLNYGAVDWRLRLAGILAGMGHVSRAMEEARICLRLRPQCAEAQKMISDLSIRKDAVDGAGTGPADGANRAADAALGGLPTR